MQWGVASASPIAPGQALGRASGEGRRDTDRQTGRQREGPLAHRCQDKLDSDEFFPRPQLQVSLETHSPLLPLS